MTIVKHELKQGKSSFLIWTAAIAMLLAVCVFLFPEMKGEMDGISDIFASMGSFIAAFGMDRLNFGTIVGFYAIECGNVLGLLQLVLSSGWLELLLPIGSIHEKIFVLHNIEAG